MPWGCSLCCGMADKVSAALREINSSQILDP